jgi:hypothetical protein
MVKSPRLVLIGTSLLLLAGIRCTQAQEIKIVSPSAYEDIEGEGEVGEDCCPPLRYQQVFPAADFAALGNKPHWLVGITWRPDQSVTSPRTVLFPDNEIRFSTTQRSILSLVFDDNVGSDVMQFYRGPRTAVADVAGPGPGPREFFNSDFPAGVTPFLYDPSQGNLLYDAFAWQGVSPSPRDDKVPALRTALYSFNPIGALGIRDPATIYQFTFIPVPEPSSLTLLAVLLVLGSLCRRAPTTKTAPSTPPTT